METFDLEPFVAFMKSRGLPPERNIPYYASWVRRYLQVEMPGVIADSTDKIRYFCEQLARKEGVQDWQIEQAQRAIELYEGPSDFVRGFLIAFKHPKSFEQKHAEPAKAPCGVLAA
jgi:hypothetical protein